MKDSTATRLTTTSLLSGRVSCRMNSVMLFPSGIVIVIWASYLASVSVHASCLQRTLIASASIHHSRQRRTKDTPFSPSTPLNVRRRAATSSTSEADTLLVARRSRRTKGNIEQSTASASTAILGASVESPTATYKELTLIGKVVAGVVEITVVMAFDYILGFCGGYGLGTIWGLPNLVFRKGDSTSSSLMQEALSRLAGMHQRSTRWAKSWGGVNAVVGGFGVSARVLRGGVRDEWTDVFSSMAMGAFFARKSKHNKAN